LLIAADLARGVFEGVAIGQQHFLRASGVEFRAGDFDNLAQAAAREKEPAVGSAQIAGSLQQLAGGRLAGRIRAQRGDEEFAPEHRLRRYCHTWGGRLDRWA
jgi:hypothetical protein